MERLERKFLVSRADGSLSIYDHNNHNVINLDDILYLKAMAGYSMVMVENESKHISTHPLNYFEDLLPENQFFRIHKSYLIIAIK